MKEVYTAFKEQIQGKKASKMRRYSLQAKDIASKGQKENESKILAVDNLNSSSRKSTVLWYSVSSA